MSLPWLINTKAIKQLPLDPIKQLPLDPIKQLPLDPIKQLPLDPIKQLPLDPIKQLPLDPIKQLPLDPIKQLPLDPIKQLPLDPIKQLPLDPIKQLPKQKSNNYYKLYHQKWFYYLKDNINKETKIVTKGLWSEIPKTSPGLFICRYGGPSKKAFSHFSSISAFQIYMSKFSEAERTFFEVILNMPQKPHFDLDPKNITVGVCDLMVSELISGIVEEFDKTFSITLDVTKNILKYTGHGPDKCSAHVLVDGYYHTDNVNAKQFYNNVINRIKDRPVWKESKDGVAIGAAPMMRAGPTTTSSSATPPTRGPRSATPCCCTAWTSTGGRRPCFTAPSSATRETCTPPSTTSSFSSSPRMTTTWRSGSHLTRSKGRPGTRWSWSSTTCTESNCSQAGRIRPGLPRGRRPRRHSPTASTATSTT